MVTDTDHETPEGVSPARLTLRFSVLDLADCGQGANPRARLGSPQNNSTAPFAQKVGSSLPSAWPWVGAGRVCALPGAGGPGAQHPRGPSAPSEEFSVEWARVSRGPEA